MLKQLLTLAFAIVVYGGLIYIGDLSTIIEHASLINTTDLSLALLFLLLALFFEFLRWLLYMKELRISLPVKRHLGIFLSGLALGFLPSKTGELIRYHLLKKQNIRLSESVPVHFVSNITNLLVILILSSPVLFTLNVPAAFIILILIVLFLVSIQNPKYHIKIIDYLYKKTGFNPLKTLAQSFRSAKKLMQHHFQAIFYTVLSYISMAGIFYIIKEALGIQASIILIFSFYLISLILGVISMLPGGIGAVEGGSIVMFSQLMSTSDAISLVLITRLFTLWLTTAIGAVSLQRNI